MILTQPLVGPKVCRSSVNHFLLGLMAGREITQPRVRRFYHPSMRKRLSESLSRKAGRRGVHITIQTCAEKRDCFAKHQPWRGRLWLAAAGQKFSLNLAPFLLLNPVRTTVVPGKIRLATTGSPNKCDEIIVVELL